jgi:hypothetical protein
MAPLQLPAITSFPPEHVYATPTPTASGYPSPMEPQKTFNSSRNSTKWTDDEEEEDDDSLSDTNRFTVKLQRDDVTGLGFIVSSRDGQANSEVFYYCSLLFLHLISLFNFDLWWFRACTFRE